MDAAARNSMLPVEDRDPRVILSQAVDNARVLSNDPCEDVSQDTVGLRLVGLALAQLDSGETRKAAEGLREALQIHRGTQNWQALARLAFLLTTRNESQNGGESS